MVIPALSVKCFLEKWKVTIKLIAGPQIVYLIKTDDESYHWSYKQSGDKQKVKLKEVLRIIAKILSFDSLFAMTFLNDY